MKIFMYFLCFLLLAAPLYADYKEVINTNEAILLEEGTLYLDKPFLVYQGNNFTIQAVVLVNETGSQTDFSLERGRESLEPTYEAGDVTDDQSYVLLTWSDRIEENSTYTLRYTKNGKELYEEDFTVQAQPRVVVRRDVQEKTLRSDPITDNQREFIISMLAREGIDLTLEEFKEQEEQAKQVTSLNKVVTTETFYFNDNSTEVRTFVTLNVDIENGTPSVRLVETIPKSFAFSVSVLSFSEEPIVLEDDPVVMWHLENVEQSELRYSTQGNLTLTGNTILLTDTIREQEASDVDEKVFWPLLLIPLIAGIIIYFANKQKK